MSTLSAEQIARYAYDAGFRGQSLTVAVAVALAESSGRARAHNAVPPDNSYGLWQINMLGALGPDRRHALHLDSNAALFDPAVNARAAFMISGHGSSWRPWSTYTNGAYRAHLTVARHAAAKAREHGGHGGGGSGGVGSGGHGSGKPGHHGGGHGHRKGHGHGGTRGNRRVVLDFAELRRLGQLFQHSADRVEHTRRAVRSLAADLEPARCRLPDPALGGLIASVMSTIDAPTQLALAAARLDRQGRYADDVRELAQRADGPDNRWSRADIIRFVGTIGGKMDPVERAVLESALGSRLVAAPKHQGHGNGNGHLEPRDHDGDKGHVGSSHSGHHVLPAAGVAGLANGRVPPSRLTPVGDGEKMTKAAGSQFRRMDAAARAAGLNLHVNSGYRSYGEQAALYNDYVHGRGALAAQPGHSTHGVGLSADINVTDGRTLNWLRRHAGTYGFVNDVPSEPWHWTYRPHH